MADTHTPQRLRVLELALREAEQHLRNVFDHSPLGICTADLRGRLLSANPALERMLGVAPGAATGYALADLVHPDDVAPVEATLRRLVGGEVERLAMEKRCRRPAGGSFWARLTASTVRDEGGAPLYVIAMVEDIDERRRVDAAMEDIASRLESLNRAKSALVAGVSHEFRTALTGIEGFSELLRDQDPGPAEAKELAADINSEARRLARLIDDLLDLDGMESGGVGLRRQPIDVNSLLASLADRARRNVTGHRVQVRLAADLPAIHADPDRLTQVLANLLSNAVKYSPAGSLVEVTSEPVEDGVRLVVRDHGPGIPPDSLERVFDRYTRLERERRSRVTGTGLGLPIVRQIVRMHGGRVWASNAPGGGAALVVELPVLGEPEEVYAGPVL